MQTVQAYLGNNGKLYPTEAKCKSAEKRIANKIAKEKALESGDDPYAFIFIVYAHAGRYNGSLICKAKNKTDAKKLARNCGWLEYGTVDEAQSLREYAEDMSYDDVETCIEEDGLEVPKEFGDNYELDWGS